MLLRTLLHDAIDFGKLVDSFVHDYEYAGSYPEVHVTNDNDQVRLTAIVPGVGKDDINVSLDDGFLILEGEKKEDYRDAKYLRKERKFGSFKRKIRLPYSVDAENIQANIDKGILTITLHKSEEAKPKRIEIR